MRVTHVTWGYPSQVEGHEATYFANQVESLSRIGHSTFNVVAPVTWVPRVFAWTRLRWRRRLSIAPAYEHNGIHVYRPRFVQLPTPKAWNSELFLLEGVIRRQLKMLKPDLVHVHGANAFGLAALYASQTLSVPSVLTLHGGDVYDSPFLSKHHFEVFSKAMKIPSRRIAVSLDLAEKATSLVNVPVLHLPLGIDLRRFTTRTPIKEARDQFRLPHDFRIVLYLGNLLQAKGVQVLLDSLRGSAKGTLGVFAGSGPMAPMIEQHPRALLLGPVSYGDVPALISAADVLVLPSFSEGLGTVLVEAGALGVPVVGTTVGGIPSLLGNGRGYLVPVNDPVVLSQVITKVLENPSDANNRASELKTFVLENYDSGINSAKLFDIYNELI